MKKNLPSIFSFSIARRSLESASSSFVSTILSRKTPSSPIATRTGFRISFSVAFLAASNSFPSVSYSFL